jgi:hypothetical protein
LTINEEDVGLELCKGLLPLVFKLVGEHITGKVFKLSDLILHFFVLNVDLLRASCNLGQVWSQNGVELLNDDASFFDVIKYTFHIDR